MCAGIRPHTRVSEEGSFKMPQDRTITVSKWEAVVDRDWLENIAHQIQNVVGESDPALAAYAKEMLEVANPQDNDD
jgi:hypothetical protein